MQRHGQRGGHLGAEIEAVVGQAGFEQQHGNVGVFREPRGQHIARAAGADDDVVVGGFEAHFQSFCSIFQTACVLRRPSESGWSILSGVVARFKPAQRCSRLAVLFSVLRLVVIQIMSL